MDKYSLDFPDFYMRTKLPDECIQSLLQQFRHSWATKDRSFRYEWDNKEESIATGGISHETWDNEELVHDPRSPSLVPTDEAQFVVDVEGINLFIKNILPQPMFVKSYYGPRVYLNGAILESHTDEYHITGIIFIDSESPEQWPLVLQPEGGKKVEIGFTTGDLVIFDGYNILHGRPTPFRGEYYTAIFLRLEPEPDI